MVNDKSEGERSEQGLPVADARESRATAVAAKLLRVFDQHPMVKLLCILWIGLVSLWAPIDAYRRERAEARRGGWAIQPEVDVGTSTDSCVLVNVGSRPLAEVTLHWNLYHVDLTACAVLENFQGSQTQPMASSRELLPRDRVTAPFGGQRTQRNCQKLACPPGHECSAMVECQARYHRAVDVEPFTSSRFAFAENSCRQLVGLGTVTSFQAGQQRWNDPRRRQIWTCFLDFRRRLFPQQAEMLERLKTLDERINRLH